MLKTSYQKIATKTQRRFPPLQTIKDKHYVSYVYVSWTLLSCPNNRYVFEDQPSHLVDGPLLLLHPDGERPERVGRQHVLPHQSDGDLSEVFGRGWVLALRGGGGRGPVRVALGSAGLEEVGDHHHHARILEKIPHLIKSDFWVKSFTSIVLLGHIPVQ